MNLNRAELLFGLVLAKPVADRALFLDRECGEDKDLRTRLDSLLAVQVTSRGRRSRGWWRAFCAGGPA